ncbi:MAG: RNA polymerase sigma factor [Planctomycetes bacterium]|nr:RNA polymerase sigma factor [Planctomycetota bacterium]
MSETSLSLLDQLCFRPDAAAWDRLVRVYTPLLQAWLRRYDVLSAADVDDLVQEVLLTVSQEVGRFNHNQAPGAFRGWLRAILINRLRHFWRGRDHRPAAIGGSDFLEQLDLLQDDASQVSRLWDSEHDRQLMRRLLDEIQPRFAVSTWQAFCRQVLDGDAAERVAEELGMPLHSVYAAKSRVLKALRSAGAGLLS